MLTSSHSRARCGAQTWPRVTAAPRTLLLETSGPHQALSARTVPPYGVEWVTPAGRAGTAPAPAPRRHPELFALAQWVDDATIGEFPACEGPIQDHLY